ncbi:zinc-binding dehydrogenase family protein [Stylonychia lemnae]|uniref:Zinc-binding dehydrogenase family protein n=1 Tax=Stylonychia lemnae TaxID=5949 RepID=A0A078ABY8_STYLE|nr:zinc-binding dehydrogenase family protein [Stylonychia lemnae]|eukprot:CDW78288.1 zinc-binding dehydrogenase family protein [Stylonychia lemnae]
MVEANQIPTKQQGLRVYSGGTFKVDEIDVPRPGPGQLLVKIECAPINPSDIFFMKGIVEEHSKGSGRNMIFPIVPGWEGSGTVIASGGGLMAWRLVGKRVAVSKMEEPDRGSTVGGCFQQYMITNALQCLPLPDDVSFEVGAMHFVNPLTAIGLLDRAKQYKAQAAIQTGAASQLGRMIIRLAQEEKIPLINIVRRPEQVQLLQDQGAENILNSSDPDFLDRLGELAKKLKATVCFEAVAGDLTGEIMSKMPFKSTCIVYGCLSEQPVGGIESLVLIGRNQKLEGFLLNNWTKEKSLWSLGSIISKCQRLMRNKTLQSEVARRISMYEVEQAIPEYQKNMTQGKYIVYPHEKQPTQVQSPPSLNENEESKHESESNQ